ncbi:MAG: T9SS type A sorting domain-containing protein [Bacteroidetes bacterium]|nr:T9SS type A sorting domain-containing protein [Bacteroidota bacterium]
MKKLFILTILLISFFVKSTNAQISWGGIPFSMDISIPDNKKNNDFQSDYKLKDLVAYEINANYEWNAIYQEDEFNDVIGMPKRTGVDVVVGLNPSNSGTWEQLPDGRLLWRIKIVSPGAKSLSIIVDDFNLPENSRLFVYDENYSNILGSFDYRNNNAERIFTTHLLPGNTFIVEYEQFPIKGFDNSSASADFSFNIGSLLYNYLNGGPFDVEKNLGASGPCMVNVNCPEGTDWQKEKRGVAKIIFKVGSSYFLCSGSLINNTQQNATPYFLTAEHCGGEASAADRNMWQFYFNYERPGCPNTGTPANNMLTGASLKALGLLNGGSDFQLLTLNSSPSSSWNPYFNGWSRSSTGSSSGVSIHHPSGDAKKISTYTSLLTSATVTVDGETMATNSAWRVVWKQTASGHSVTEGGSSGSPIFNNNKQIVGSLTGGGATCTNLSSADYYGKFDYHWESNGTTNDKKLRPWLDPVGSNPITLNGYDPYNDDNDNEVIFYEGFESGSIPSGWTQVQETGALNWTVGAGNDAGFPAGAYSGAKNAYFKIVTDVHVGYKTKLITPPINIPSGSTTILTFYIHNQEWEGDQDRLRLYYKTSPSGSWVLFGANNTNITQWTKMSYYLPNTSSTYYIAFENEAYWGRGLCIDEVKVELLTNTPQIETDSFIANIFPNPAFNALFVEINSNEFINEISIIDLQGSLIEKRKTTNTDRYVFDISNLPAGMYLVRIAGKDVNKTMKFVKAK